MERVCTIKNLDDKHQHFGHRILIWFALAWFLSTNVAIAASEKIYSFGVVPQQSATKLAQNWIPLLQELQKTWESQ